jgi:hypothetical protein
MAQQVCRLKGKPADLRVDATATRARAIALLARLKQRNLPRLPLLKCYKTFLSSNR